MGEVQEPEDKVLEPVRDLQWVLNTYYASIDTSIDTAYNYLHTTINWTISVFTAVILFVASRDSFPDALTWAALWGSAVFVTHFAARAGKGYLNVLRAATIQRRVLDYKSDGSAVREAAIWEALQSYHVEWRSPVRFSTVIQKLLFELGFAYMYALIGALLVYTANRLPMTSLNLSLAAAGLAAMVVEGLLLWRSPYLRSVAVDPQTQSLR